jgi:TonB family protein
MILPRQGRAVWRARSSKILVASLVLGLAACGAGGGASRDRGIFLPRSDYGFPPNPRAYSAPGDCQGGAALAAVDVRDPEYPDRAYRQGLQGWVAVRLDVDAAGRPRKVDAIDSQPRGVFDRAAVKTVRSWRFEPPVGGPLSACVVVLDYRLGIGRIGL